MAIQVGDVAPDFTLFNSDKQEVTLSTLQGKNIVLLFFPLAFTGVCTAELCSMRDDIATYSGLDAEIIALSVDSIFVLEKFKAEQNLPFQLVSDFNKKASNAYGAIYGNFVLGMEGVSKRAAFVIDKNGVVQYAEVLESAGDLPNFDEVKVTLSAIK